MSDYQRQVLFFPESKGIGLDARRPGATLGWLWQTNAYKRSFTRQNAEYTNFIFNLVLNVLHVTCFGYISPPILCDEIFHKRFA